MRSSDPSPISETGDQSSRTTSAAAGARPAIFVSVEGGEAFRYLLERYAEQAGYRFQALDVARRPSSMPPAQRPAALWVPSLERLEAVRPRESVADEDLIVIVCANAGDEARAQALGADVCVPHPLRYGDFLEVMASVGMTPGARDVEGKGRLSGDPPSP